MTTTDANLQLVQHAFCKFDARLFGAGWLAAAMRVRSARRAKDTPILDKSTSDVSPTPKQGSRVFRFGRLVLNFVLLRVLEHRDSFLLNQNRFDSGQDFIYDGLRHGFLEANIPRAPVQ